MLEECVGRTLEPFQVFSLAAAFYVKYCSSPDGRTKLMAHKLHRNLAEKTTASGRKVRFEIRLEAGSKEALAVAVSDFRTGEKLLQRKYGRGEIAKDLLFAEVIDFLVANGPSIIRDQHGSTEAGMGSEVWLCEVCGDDACLRHCDANVCAKCKSFFDAVLSRRTVLTMRCAKGDDCKDECTGEVDIGCDKCRFARCVKVGMVKRHYIQIASKKQVCCTCTCN